MTQVWTAVAQNGRRKRSNPESAGFIVSRNGDRVPERVHQLGDGFIGQLASLAGERALVSSNSKF